MCANHPKKLSPKQRRAVYDQLSKCLEREDNLINYRMTWGLTWNAAVFALVASLPKIDFLDEFKNPLMFISSIFGISISVMTFIAVSAAHKQIEFVIRDAEHRLCIRRDDWNKSEFIRPYGDPNSVHPQARRMSGYFPLVFVLMWMVVLTISLTPLYPKPQSAKTARETSAPLPSTGPLPLSPAAPAVQPSSAQAADGV